MNRNIQARPCRCRECEAEKKRTGRHPRPKGTRQHPITYRVRWRQNGRQFSRGGFTRKVDAEEFLTETLADVQRGDAPNPLAARQTFEDFAERWLADRQAALTPKTYSGYRDIVNAHLVPAFGPMPLGSIDPTHVSDLVRDLKKKLAPNTQRNVWRVLKQIMDEAVALRAIRQTPCTDATRKKLSAPRRNEMLALTSDEVARLAEALGERDPQLRVLIYLAADTGCRWGELIGLRVRDFDPLHGVLHVRQNITYAQGAWHVGRPKGLPANKEARVLTLSPFVAAMLTAHIKNRVPDALVFASPRRATDYLRSRATHDHFKKATAKVLPEAKHGLRFHDLRHTCAALLIANGAHPKAISDRLGHSTIQITMDRYGHLYPNADEALAEGLDRVWRAANGSDEELREAE